MTAQEMPAVVSERNAPSPLMPTLSTTAFAVPVLMVYVLELEGDKCERCCGGAFCAAATRSLNGLAISKTSQSNALSNVDSDAVVALYVGPTGAGLAGGRRSLGSELWRAAHLGCVLE